MKNALSQILQAMQAQLQAHQLSPSTERAYTDWVYRFLLLYQEDGLPLDIEHVSRFLHFLKHEKQLAPASRIQALQALIFLYKHVWHIPLKRAEFPRPQRRHAYPATLSREQVKALLHQLAGDLWLMAGLLYGCGLHVCECLGLRKNQLDMEHWQLHLSASRHCQARVLPLPCCLHKELKGRLQGQTQTDALLFTGKGKEAAGACRQASPSYLQKALQRAGRAAHIPQKTNAQKLRHSFALHVLEEGADVHQLQYLMGHRHLRSSLVYLQLFKKKELQSPLDSFLMV